jgi:hypothetical protein
MARLMKGQGGEVNNDGARAGQTIAISTHCIQRMINERNMRRIVIDNTLKGRG